MIITNNSNLKFYKLLRVRAMADLFEGEWCLSDKEVLDGIFERDFLNKKEIAFIYGGKRYLRHYLWEPQGGVTRIKIGYKVKSKFVGAIVYVNYSRQRYDPYVVIIDRDRAFDDSDMVAEMVARALSRAYNGSCTELKLEPWTQAEMENNDWGFDCMEAHAKGDGKGVLSSQSHFGLETCVNRATRKNTKRAGVSPPGKKTGDEIERPPKTLRTAIIDSSNANRILRKIRNCMKGKTDPEDVMMPITAAYAARVMKKPSFTAMKNSHPEVKISPASFYRLINPDCKAYQDNDAFRQLVTVFKEI